MAAFATPARATAGEARDTVAMHLAASAVESLLDEARLSPKPGLVDRRGNGAHRDLTLPLMCRSARSLGPGFVRMAEAARLVGEPTLALRETLGRLGRDVEATMLAATGGVNSHRGAIWALGLLVSAAALVVEDDDAVVVGATSGASAIAACAAAIAVHADRHTGAPGNRKGAQACRDFGVGGARGQAQAGFPHVTRLGLPELRRSRSRGDSETAARLNALLAIISRLDDTCVLARGGLAALRAMQSAAVDVLAAGGAATLAGRRVMRELDALAIATDVSPGGAADLLAATLFLDRVEHRGRALRRASAVIRRIHGKA